MSDLNQHILIIRPQLRHADDLAVCAQHGWQGVPFAPLAIVPLSTTLSCRLPESLAQAVAVFWVSPSAVEIGAMACSGSLKHVAVQHIAVGQATAQRLRDLGAKQVWCAKHGNDSEAVLRLPIWSHLPQQSKVLIVRGEQGRDFLAQQLSERAYSVQTIEIYRRVPQVLDWSALLLDKAQPCLNNGDGALLPRAAWVTSGQVVQEFWRQIPPKLAQNVHSLLYFTHHDRIVATLRGLGAQNVRLVSDLAQALRELNSANVEHP